jgi:hypothetical protein
MEAAKLLLKRAMVCPLPIQKEFFPAKEPLNVQ